MRDMVSHSDVSVSVPRAPLLDRVRAAGRRLKAWLEARAERAGEAAMYQQLSKLSDAELERRGIPRGELYRCVSGTFDAWR
jgi:hypothetical protein